MPCEPPVFVHRAFSPLEHADPMAKRTRVTVKILEGNDLLVSDLLTGTSDPVALLWVSSSEEGEVDFKGDKRIQVGLTMHAVNLLCVLRMPSLLYYYLL